MTEHKNTNNKKRTGIGTLNENSLHADIIHSIAQDGDQLEAELNGFFIDILRKDKAIEVQTRNLGKLSRKVLSLAMTIPVEIVYPISETKLITKINRDGKITSQRKSPKRGKITDIFDELVRATNIFTHPSITLTALMIDAEEIWRDDGQGSWRRKGWSIHERKLIRVINHINFTAPEDLLKLLPKSLPAPFTNQQLAKSLGIRVRSAGKITYTFRKMNLLEITGKEGNSYLFEIL
jgi:hypothetical protein